MEPDAMPKITVYPYMEDDKYRWSAGGIGHSYKQKSVREWREILGVQVYDEYGPVPGCFRKMPPFAT